MIPETVPLENRAHAPEKTLTESRGSQAGRPHKEGFGFLGVLTFCTPPRPSSYIDAQLVSPLLASVLSGHGWERVPFPATEPHVHTHTDIQVGVPQRLFH